MINLLTCKYCGKKFPLSEDYAHSQHQYGHDEEIKRIRRWVKKNSTVSLETAYFCPRDLLREFQHKEDR